MNVSFWALIAWLSFNSADGKATGRKDGRKESRKMGGKI
jgi:hypothetical protein